jgi:hypothetical protein
MAMAQNEQPVQALGPDRPHPTFRVGVSPWRSDWCLDHLDAFGAKHLIEAGGERGVPVPDEESDGATSVDEITDQISGQLGDQRTGRMVSDTEDVNLSRREFGTKST